MTNDLWLEEFLQFVLNFLLLLSSCLLLLSLPLIYINKKPAKAQLRIRVGNFPLLDLFKLFYLPVFLLLLLFPGVFNHLLFFILSFQQTFYNH